MKHFSLLDGQISGVRWGQGKTKILAFHGFLDNAMSFQPMAENLADVELWSIDLPGHGLSSALPQTDGMLLLHWLPTLGRVLDELNWDEFRILGHSLGAIVSQLLASVDDRVTALYSLDALGPLASTSEQNLNRLKQIYRNRNKRVPVRFYSSYQKVVESRLTGQFPLSERAAAAMAKRAVGMSEKGWYHRYDRHLRQDSIWRMQESDVLAMLTAISCPIHLAVFSADQWEGYQGVFEHRKKAVSQLHLDHFPGSHHFHMEQPHTLARWLNAQLLL